jgi:hypothetical protein
MIENQERLQRGKDLIRFFLTQATNNLEQAKMQCLFIHPAWQTVEGKIREALKLVEGILKTSTKED